MKEIKARLQGDTPSFFKKLRAIGLSLTAVGTGIIGIPATLAAVSVAVIFPPALLTIAGYMIAAGSVVTVVSQLTVVDPETLPKKD